MSMVFSVYSQNAFKEFVLPAVNNAETSIVLKQNLFGLRENVVLPLETLDGKWRFLDGPCKIVRQNSPYHKEQIRDGESYTVYTAYGEKLYLIVREDIKPFYAYTKFDVRQAGKVTIGSSSSAAISYSYLYEGNEFVSGNHAVIHKENQGWVLEDCSRNGTFLNNRRVQGRQSLHFGDRVNIWGLTVIILGDAFAVSKGVTVKINETVLKPCGRDDIVSWGSLSGRIDPKEAGTSVVEYYNRPPRSLEPLYADVVEIEGPPAPKEENDTPLFMQIGPALTMTLPMLLGSGMAVVTSRLSSAASSGFMYTGLVTAGCSGLIGAFWAFNNVRYAKQRQEKDETRRFEAYSEYLIKCTERVREKYERNTEILRKRYRSVEEMLGNGRIPEELWGRNVSHEDFLYQRLGIGDMPFQVQIAVPKEKFSLIHDSLAGKPAFIKDNYEILHEVPVGIDLLRERLVGVIGGEGKRGAVSVIQNLIAQIGIQNCYTDVKMIFVCDREEADFDGLWGFAKWFPHVWSEDKEFRYMAANRGEVSDVFYEVTKVLRRREEDSGNSERRQNSPTPHYVLFIENSSAMEGELIEKYVYEREKELGLTTIFLAERYEELPNACECIIQNDSQFRGIYHVQNQNEKMPVTFDSVEPELLRNFAVKLSNIAVNTAEVSGEIPSAVTFLEMYGVKKLRDLKVTERWKKNRNYESMRALIGQKNGGQPCYLDLHEKYHGPHGLVAGTTGSGKSETLQTYILSLAINFSPDDIGFFLIDYKGGGMGNLFTNLPHVLGQISNLSGNQVHRAMVSIKSENLRRQRIFNENGVNNINLYTNLYKNGEAKIPIPHLFIIIDEFAELKREEPDFMRELISVAQVGRSLGVHLILATQKPSGTVDDNIWSNAKFHLCLRVQDRQDSMDMLHKPDAAYLINAGRGYLQVGSDEIYEEFQSGWSGAAYDEEDEDSSDLVAKMITTTGKAAIIGNHAKSERKTREKVKWIAALLACLDPVMARKDIKDYHSLISREDEEGSFAAWFEEIKKAGIDYPANESNEKMLRNLLKLLENEKGSAAGNFRRLSRDIYDRAREQKLKLPEMKEKTQLEAIVNYLARLAENEGYKKQQPLWLPVLPTAISLEELRQTYGESTVEASGAEDGWPVYDGYWKLKVNVGLCDDPARQTQVPLTLDFSEDGNLAVCGIASSGKSTFLQTVIYGLLRNYSPRCLNVYLLDFSSHAMEGFEQAPHVGGVLYENDLDTIGKFFNMVVKMLDERKALFRGGNYGQYIRKNGTVCPAVVIAIDNVGAFREKTENKYDDLLVRLSKECAANGIYLLLSGNGFGLSEIPTKIAENIRRSVCLQMQDKFQYADVLNTMQIQTIPESGVRGRGLALYEDVILEFQTCLAVDAEDDYGRLEKIRLSCEEMENRWTGRKAKPIPRIPQKPVWADFRQLEETEAAIQSESSLPIGYEMETADIYSVDLSRLYCYIISGKSRAGKTNLMRIMIRCSAEKQANIAVMEFGDAELKGEAVRANAEYIGSTDDCCEFMRKMIPVFQERNARKKELREQGMESAEIFTVMSRETPYFIYIADLVEFIKTIYGPDGLKYNIGGLLTNLLEKGSGLNIYFIACFNWAKRTEALGTDVYNAFISYKCGIHLGGNSDAQMALDIKGIPLREQQVAEKVGIGVTSADETSDSIKVVIPLSKG